MTSEAQLVSALIYVDNLTETLKDNEWKTYIYSHLLPIKFELQRQLTNMQQQSTMNTNQLGDDEVSVCD